MANNTFFQQVGTDVETWLKEKGLADSARDPIVSELQNLVYSRIADAWRFGNVGRSLNDPLEDEEVRNV